MNTIHSFIHSFLSFLLFLFINLSLKRGKILIPGPLGAKSFDSEEGNGGGNQSQWGSVGTWLSFINVLEKRKKKKEEEEKRKREEERKRKVPATASTKAEAIGRTYMVWHPCNSG